MALKNLQKFEEARNFLDTALKLEPDNLYAKIERLDVLKHLKDHDEIRRSLVEILGPNLERLNILTILTVLCFGVMYHFCIQ